MIFRRHWFMMFRFRNRLRNQKKKKNNEPIAVAPKGAKPDVFYVSSMLAPPPC